MRFRFVRFCARCASTVEQTGSRLEGFVDGFEAVGLGFRVWGQHIVGCEFVFF